MKTIRNILAAVLLLALPAAAQNYFTYKGTAQGATNSYVIIEKGSVGVPCVFFVDASINNYDNTNGAPLVFYTGAAEQNVTRAGVIGTNTIYVAATNGWAVGSVLILSRVKETQYERHTVSALSSTNLTITGTTAGPTVSGDKIYRMTVAGQVRFQDGGVSHTLAAGSLRLNPLDQPYFSGPQGRPALIEIQGLYTNTLNTVSGRWLPLTFGQ